jgi:hypothetical protein
MTTLKVNREEFLRHLEVMQPGLTNKDKTQQSSCYVFRGGKVYTCNEETACRGPSMLSAEFTGAVSARPLSELLRRLEDAELTLEMRKDKLILNGKGGKKSSLLLEQETSLLDLVRAVDKPQEWKPLHPEFAEAIRVVSQCARPDEKHGAGLTCVHVHPKWVETCDNYQACRWTLKTGVEESVLVRSKSISELDKIAPVEMAVTDGWLHFRSAEGVMLSCRRFIDDFPELTEMFSMKGVASHLPNKLVDATERANIFSSENGEFNYVTVKLRPDRVVVEGIGITGSHTEPKRAKYAGPPIDFVIAPNLLIKLAREYPQCEISQDKIKVNGAGKFAWVAVLTRPEEQAEEEERAQTEEPEQENEEESDDR